MTSAIALHVSLGVALAGLVWLAGSGAVVLLRIDARGADAVYAYPLGLLVVLAPCVLFLVHPALGALGLAAPVAAVVLALHHRVAARDGMVTVLTALPGIAAFAGMLGSLYHGPTATRGGGAFGDMTWYVAKLATAKEPLFPYRDLAALDVDLWKAELGVTVLGATLDRLGLVEPFLFHASLLPAFLLTSLCVGFAILRRERPTNAGVVATVVLVALAIGMLAYPSWVVESSPVTLALPLGFAIHRLSMGEPSRRVLLVVGAAIAAALVATKGFALIPFAIVLGYEAVRRRLFSRKELAIVLAVTLAIGVPVLLTTLRGSSWIISALGVRLIPLDALEGLRSQLDVRSTQQLAPALNVVAGVALAAALWRLRARALLAALLVSLAWIWVVTPNFLMIGFRLTVLLTVLHLYTRPTILRRELLFVSVPAAALAAEAWLRDFAGLRAALLLVLALGAVLFAALARHRVAAVAPLVACAIAALVGIGQRAPALGPEDYDIWRRVAQTVPGDALVFTSLTGRAPTSRESFSYYPAIARRQLFLAGWYESQLREDPDELARRFAANNAVLSGAAQPQRYVEGGRFSGYYAVVRGSDNAPPDFRLLYRNRAFAIYRIG